MPLLMRARLRRCGVPNLCPDRLICHSAPNEEQARGVLGEWEVAWNLLERWYSSPVETVALALRLQMRKEANHGHVQVRMLNNPRSAARSGGDF
jgi:hypothetical protein